MFNKPALFPKGSDPQPGRPSRIGAGNVPPGAMPGLASGPGAGLQKESAPQPAGPAASGEPEGAAATGQTGGSRLIVGPNVKLRGAEILDCDTLVVEGRVEATMDSRVLRISENGSFAGTVGIDVAEVFGRFEGELTARTQLVIHSTGRVTGKIRYGKILIEEGGEVSGDVQSLAAVPREQTRGAEQHGGERPENQPKVA